MSQVSGSSSCGGEVENPGSLTPTRSGDARSNIEGGPESTTDVCPTGRMGCSICLAVSARMVRDHNHETGMIRGILCEQCNSRLGTYEANLKRRRQRGKAKFKKWQEANQERITSHLAKDTGIKYSKCQKFAKQACVLWGKSTE